MISRGQKNSALHSLSYQQIPCLYLQKVYSFKSQTIDSYFICYYFNKQLPVFQIKMVANHSTDYASLFTYFCYSKNSGSRGKEKKKKKRIFFHNAEIKPLLFSTLKILRELRSCESRFLNVYNKRKTSIKTLNGFRAILIILY